MRTMMTMMTMTMHSVMAIKAVNRESQTMNSIRDEIERSTEGMPLLGYTVQWSLRGVQIEHDELVKALAGCGFARYAPDPPTPRKALRRAIESWVLGRSRAGHGAILSKHYSQDDEQGDEAQRQGQGRRQQVLVRTINQRDSEYLVFALVLEEADLQALGLSYGTDLRVLLRKSDLSIAITATASGRIDAGRSGGPTPPVAAELPEYWARYRNLHTAEDLSRLVCQIVRGMEALSLLAGGGTYFVPTSAGESLGHLRTLMGKLEAASAAGTGRASGAGGTGTRVGSSFLLTLGVPDAQATRRSLSRAAHTSFMDELAVLHTDLQRFTAAPEGTVKEKTVRDRLLQYKEMHARAEMYAALLDMQKDQITNSLRELEAQALAIVLAAPTYAPSQASDDATDGGVEEREAGEPASRDAPGPLQSL